MKISLLIVIFIKYVVIYRLYRKYANFVEIYIYFGNVYIDRILSMSYRY